MTSNVVDNVTAAPKPRREFLGPLKSLVRSISGNNLAAKNKKLKNTTSMPAPPPAPAPAPAPQRPRPEKLVKGRRRASSFWSKKPTPPYYGDTHDLRCSSADQLASTLRQSFRAVGFQDVTPYDNPALGTISRQPSSSRLSVHPLATPNVPTIIFSPKSPRSPNSFSPPSPWSLSSPSRPSSRPSSRPPSRPPSRPGTPGTTELRFDIPAFLPPRPKRSRSDSNSSSDFGSLRGTPQGSTVSLSQHLRSSGITGASPVQSPVQLSHSLPYLSNRTTSVMSTSKNNTPPKYPDDGPSMWNPSGKHEPRSNSVLVKSPVKAAPSPLRESPLTASLTDPARFANGRTATEQTETVPMSPLAIPQFPNLNDDGRPVSLAGSELSAPGLNKLLTGFDEVDAQLHEMITQRGRELSESVGSPKSPTRPINFAVAV